MADRADAFAALTDGEHAAQRNDQEKPARAPMAIADATRDWNLARRGAPVAEPGRPDLMAAGDPDRRRRVRSFVRRPGRLTPGQRRALDELLPRYRVGDDIADLRRVFERPAPLVVEIGFGNGEALAEMVAAESDKNFVGIEVHEPGVGRLLNRVARCGLDNVRVAMHDAVDVLSGQTASASIDELRIYFPDPWPKKRHHKRRLVQPTFVELAADRLADGGLLHLATDWAPYADWMVEVLATSDALDNVGDPFVQRPAWRPRTHFESRGARKGHRIFDLLYRRRARRG